MFHVKTEITLLLCGISSVRESFACLHCGDAGEIIACSNMQNEASVTVTTISWWGGRARGMGTAHLHVACACHVLSMTLLAAPQTAKSRDTLATLKWRWRCCLGVSQWQRSRHGCRLLDAIPDTCLPVSGNVGTSYPGASYPLTRAARPSVQAGAPWCSSLRLHLVACTAARRPLTATPLQSVLGKTMASTRYRRSPSCCMCLAGLTFC